MNHLGLFEGIGGFSLAARWMGWHTVAWCEKDKKAQAVLRKNFPRSAEHENILNLKGKQYENKIDLITAGFPCQPFSVAGKRKGTQDERYLWSETLRVISEVRPTWFIGENVAGLATMENSKPFDKWIQIGVESQNYFRRKYTKYIYNKRQSNVLNEIIESLIQENYQVQTFIIPACGIGAWHRRNRIWIVAHSNRCASGRDSRKVLEEKKRKGVQKSIKVEQSDSASKIRIPTDTNSERLEGRNYCRNTKQTKPRFRQSSWSMQGIWKSEPNVGRVANGIRGRVDRLKQLGNAIVPQVAYEIYKAIEVVEKSKQE